MPVHNPPRNEQAQSPLFAIPPELRDTIYRFILIASQPISPQRKSHRLEERSILQLLETCHRIRREAQRIYFSGNTFLFFDDGELDEIELPLFFRSAPAGTLERCANVALEASLGPRFNAGCPGKYCIARLEIDLSAMLARATGQTRCCEKDAQELEDAREGVQAVLTRSRGLKAFDGAEKERFGREVGERFCAAFGHLHPDYGD